MNEQLPLVEMTDKEKVITHLTDLGFKNIEEDLNWSSMETAVCIRRCEDRRLSGDMIYVFDKSGRLILIR